MAAVGQRDLQMLYLRRLSSNASATSSPAQLTSNGKLGFKIKGCSSENYANSSRNNGDFRNNGANKAGKCAPCITEELNFRAFNRGNSNGTFHQPSPEKIMVAVDVDEVLGNFVSALNQFIADRYSLNHSLSEYHVYEFFKIWNCSRDEANTRVHEFFETPYFKRGIYPIPGAQKALQKLSKFCNLSIVTSRQNAIKDHTLEWIDRHYSGFFQEIHFGNHFALDGQSRPKSDICKSLGATVLIDDNPRYAIECAEVGIKVLLFDYENSYPWCKVDYINQHPLIIKVHNWEEVEHALASCLVS